MFVSFSCCAPSLMLSYDPVWHLLAWQVAALVRNINTALVLTLLIYSLTRHFDWMAAFYFGRSAKTLLGPAVTMGVSQECFVCLNSDPARLPPPSKPQVPDTPHHAYTHAHRQRAQELPPLSLNTSEEVGGGGGPTAAAAPQLGANVFEKQEFPPAPLAFCQSSQR